MYRLGLAVIATLLSAAACSAGAGPETAPEVSPSPSPPSTVTPSPDAEPPSTAPLAFVVHRSRAAVDVPRPVAAGLLRGEIADWADLGQPSGPLRVVAGPGVSATGVAHLATDAAAVAAARDDPQVLALVPAGAAAPTVRTLTVGGQDPLRAPESYGLRTPADAADEVDAPVVTVTVAGDIMLGRRVGAFMERSGDFAGPLRPMAERLAAADVTIGNLESTLSREGSPTQGGDSFAADPRIEDGLRLAGFDVLSLANNHVGDWGDRALVQTVERVRAMGIEPVGAGADLAEARAPVVVERAGVRIGVLATDSIGESPAAGSDRAGTNRLNMPPRTGPLDEEALDRILGDVRSLRPDVDLLVVVPHWGTQYTNVPEESQRRVGRAMAEAGADLVVGGHPHWVQGVEVVGGSLVLHSLGNFIFDMDFMRETQEGVVLEVVTWGGEVKGVDLVPYVIGDDFAPRPVEGERAQTILDLLRETSDPPFDTGR